MLGVSQRFLLVCYQLYCSCFQAVKNLVFGAKVIHRFQLSGKVTSDMSVNHIDNQTSVTGVDGCDDDVGHPQGGTPPTESDKGLSWLIGRLSKLAKFEASHHPKVAQKVCFTN